MLIFKLQTLYILDWNLIQSKLFSFPSYFLTHKYGWKEGKIICFLSPSAPFTSICSTLILLLWGPSMSPHEWEEKAVMNCDHASSAKMSRCWCLSSSTLHFCSEVHPSPGIPNCHSPDTWGNAPANISNFPCSSSSCGLLHTTLFYWLVCSLLLGLLLSFFKNTYPRVCVSP